MDRKVILSVDVGGSKYVVGLVRENGQIICKRRYNWRHISADSVVEQITEAMRRRSGRIPRSDQRRGYDDPRLGGPGGGRVGIGEVHGYLRTAHRKDFDGAFRLPGVSGQRL